MKARIIILTNPGRFFSSWVEDKTEREMADILLTTMEPDGLSYLNTHDGKQVVFSEGVIQNAIGVIEYEKDEET